MLWRLILYFTNIYALNFFMGDNHNLHSTFALYYLGVTFVLYNRHGQTAALQIFLAAPVTNSPDVLLFMSIILWEKHLILA